jgi:SAM-dependent methyltransferase
VDNWFVPGIERERARLYGREAERYDRFRPGYPAALIDEVLGPSPHRLSVLDVGCGTGIASRLMAARGAQVLGVELNPEMAEIAQRHGIPTEVVSFEEWDPAERTFDRVSSAQAWHWLDPAVSSDKAASVLGPDGRVCIFWSMGHHPDDLADALEATYKRVLPQDWPALVVGYAANSASNPTADVGVVANALQACKVLEEPQLKSFDWTRSYTRDEWLHQLVSHSDHAALNVKSRKKLFDEIGTTIDRFGGSFVMTYVTILLSATRR